MAGPPDDRPSDGRGAGPLPGAAAVILNWRTPDLTIRAATALLAEGLPPDRLVIVDNGSGDGPAIAAGVPGCRVVQLQENIGFARGNNIGAGVITASAYLFVNSDAFVHRAGSLECLQRALNRPGIGVVVPKLLNADLSLQPSVRAFLRPRVAALAATSLDRLIPDDAQPRLGWRWSHRRSRLVDCATGAVLLVDGPAWRELGGFDESRFMYGEDVDLQWRAQRRGWGTWFADDAEFVHLGNASGALRDEEWRWEQMGAGEAAAVRANLGRAEARLTVTILRSGLAARALLYRMLGLRARAARARGLLRGLGS